MKFLKMHGAGNDYVLVEGREGDREWSALATAMCDRHFGIGADGLLIVAPSEAADFRMIMFNPDGSESEMCGNGMRCVAKYVIDKGLSPKKGLDLRIETLAGVHQISARLKDGKVDTVRVGMGTPRFKPSEIPVAVNGTDRVIDYPIQVDGVDINVTCLSIGNPHAVAFVDQTVAQWPLLELGPKVEHHGLFPNRVNFEIVNVLDRGHLAARIWERGAGYTLASGSGACAIAVAARLHGVIDETVNIALPGGDLQVQWDGSGEVWLEGPAASVFKGVWEG